MGFTGLGVVRPLPSQVYTGRVVNPMGQGVVVPPVPAWEIERGSQKKEKNLVKKIKPCLWVEGRGRTKSKKGDLSVYYK